MANGELTNKELLQEVLAEVKASKVLTTRLSESYEVLKTSYYELKDTVRDIDITLRGTKIEREAGKGGMAMQVDQNTKCIGEMKKKQNRIVAWGTMIVAAINAAFLAFIMLLKK